MFALALALSLVGLALGPVLVALGRRQALAFAALEGLTLSLIPALLLLRILPHLYEEAGPAALLLAALGYAGLWLVERRSHRAGAHVHHAVLMPAMVIHSLLDGGSLALAFAVAGGGSTSALLGGTLVLHRLPEGLLLATALAPQIGFRRMLYRVAFLGVATVAGALGGQAMLERLPHAVLDSFVALGLGVMLRVVIHRHAAPPAGPGERALGGLGFLAGLALPALVPSPDSILLRSQSRELAIGESLAPLFVETAPALLLGLAGTVLVRALFPVMPAPSCARGVLPTVRQLVGSGVTPGAAAAFLIAAPHLEPIGAMLSFRLLGAPLTLLRVGASLVIALMAARLSAAARPAANVHAHDGAPVGVVVVAPGSLLARLRRAASEVLHPILDHVGGWYLVGLMVAAGFEAAVTRDPFAGIGAPLDVLLGALFALPAYGCALATIPLSMMLIHKGVSFGAAVSFLVVAAACNGAVLVAVRRALGLWAASVVACGTLALAVGLGLVSNALVPLGSVPDVHELLAHRHVAPEWVASALLGALLTFSLLRIGPRPWLAAAFGGAVPGAPFARAPLEGCGKAR